jgi:hypothetical protein
VYAPPVKAEIANLATTRKAQTEAKQAHPAGKATPAKNAPAKKAPAKAPAKKTAPVPAGSKLRWTLDGERDEKGRVPQSAGASDGATYAVTGSGKEWQATVTRDGKVEVLAEGVSHTTAYLRCTAANKEAVAQA